MGRRGKWFIAVSRAFNPESNEKKSQKNHKSKRKWKLRRPKHYLPVPSEVAEKSITDATKPPDCHLSQGIKLVKVEDEHSKNAYNVALTSAAAAETADVAAQAAAAVVGLTITRLMGKSREEAAAIKIQTAFRGYLARIALQGLRRLVRLKTLVDGNAAKHQTSNTLHCMQTLARVQSQIRSRRIRMREENQALQRQLQLKHEMELEKQKVGEEWDDSLWSKEQIEANLVNKQEAAIRRERALAYAFSHQQWKNSSREITPTFTNPNNPQWGWSWLERWMACRPWENYNAINKDVNDHAKKASPSVGEQIIKLYAHQDTNLQRTPVDHQKSSHSSSHHSPLTPPSKHSSAGKEKSVSSRGATDDSRSMVSLQSGRRRRQSIAGSSFGDDASLASSPTIPSYMASTESARAKSRFQSPPNNNAETPERGSVNAVKKHLSYPVADECSILSPATIRRNSDPPKLDVASLKDVAICVEQTSNGGSR
ncbi:unnamed protein product [Musa acuminata var. zebrina]